MPGRRIADLKMQLLFHVNRDCTSQAVENGATDGGHICRKLVQCQDQQC